MSDFTSFKFQKYEYKLHKNFANTLFLGKRVFYLPHCHSTNEVLFDRIKAGESYEGDIVISDFQSKGKGQRGSHWESEPGQNLLFSLRLSPTFLQSDKTWLLNVIVSNALHSVLSALLPASKVEIKWPNDIYLDDKKVAGVLIQTLLEGSRLKEAVVGVGLNVNQESFTIETATSLLGASGQAYDRSLILESVIQTIEGNYVLLKAGKDDSLVRNYHSAMRWRGELHRFRDPKGSFDGEIIGINFQGNLSIKVNGDLKHFELKEVVFID